MVQFPSGLPPVNNFFKTDSFSGTGFTPLVTTPSLTSTESGTQPLTSGTQMPGLGSGLSTGSYNGTPLRGNVEFENVSSSTQTLNSQRSETQKIVNQFLELLKYLDPQPSPSLLEPIMQRLNQIAERLSEVVQPDNTPSAEGSSETTPSEGESPSVTSEGETPASTESEASSETTETPEAEATETETGPETEATESEAGGETEATASESASEVEASEGDAGAETSEASETSESETSEATGSEPTSESGEVLAPLPSEAHPSYNPEALLQMLQEKRIAQTIQGLLGRQLYERMCAELNQLEVLKNP